MVVEGTGGRGTRHIRTSWDDNIDRTENISLIAEESLVSKKEKLGLDI